MVLQGRILRPVRACLSPILLAPALICPQLSPGSPGCVHAAVDTTSRRIASAVRRDGEIVLDGKLNESAWEKAPAITNFTQSYPAPGAKPTDPTEVRVLYDDASLYVGVRMFDARPDSIATHLARRDAPGVYSN